MGSRFVLQKMTFGGDVWVWFLLTRMTVFFFNNLSGQIAYESWTISFYNFIFTVFSPLMIEIVGPCVGSVSANVFAWTKELFTSTAFWLWIGNVLYHSLAHVLCVWEGLTCGAGCGRNGTGPILFPSSSRLIPCYTFRRPCARNPGAESQPKLLKPAVYSDRVSPMGNMNERLLTQTGSYNTNLLSGVGPFRILSTGLLPRFRFPLSSPRSRERQSIVAIGFQELLPLHLGRV